MSNVAKVASKGYPKDLRDAVNKLCEQNNRPCTIVYGSVDVPTWDYLADNQVKITLPDGFTGNLTVCLDNGDGTYSTKTAAYSHGILKTVS